MSPTRTAMLVAMMPFLVGIAGVLAWAYVRTSESRAAGAADRDALHADLEHAEAERDALRRRVEALEAIVTSEGFDVEREARRAGIAPPLDLDALPDPPRADAQPAPRRTRA